MSLQKLNTFFDSEKTLPYTGEELRPHFLLSQFQQKGSSLVAFRGPCFVKTEHLVDWEDRLNQDRIEAKEMVHFIGEFFQTSLYEGVLLQRLLMAILCDVLTEELRPLKIEGNLCREGDDLFWSDAKSQKKLSVSIVTQSPVSSLLHIGINLNSQGAPVLAVGLNELGLTDLKWVKQFLKRVEDEISGTHWACVKVRPVV